MSSQHRQVVVVGAGMAGLSAAYHLHNHGFTDVIVLEASDRLGGRIHTCQFGSDWRNIVEVGGNWIHGASGRNSILTLAQSQGLLPQPAVLLDRMEGFCYRSDGHVIDQDLAERLHSMYLSWSENEVERLGPVKDMSTRISQLQYLQQCLAEDIHKFPESEHEDIKCLFNCILNLDRFHNGGYIEDIAVPDIGGYVTYPGGDIKVPTGMSSIVYRLADQLPAESIHLCCKVSNIGINPQSQQCEILCEGGQVYTAEHVLVTASLGYLKANHQTLFTPHLPPAKIKAIENIGFGKVDKVFIYWDKPFWRPGIGSMKLCWNDQDSDMTSLDQWYKRIFALDEVLNNPNVLVGWISGDAAEHMESLTDAQVIGAITALIHHFLQDASIPAPCRVLRSRWCTNVYSRGSYSYWTATTSDKVVQDLTEPVSCAGVPRILFAGEATDCPNYSTMHGARNSGIREASRLVTHMRRRTTSKL